MSCRHNGSVFWHCGDLHAWGWMHWDLLPAAGDVVQIGWGENVWQPAEGQIPTGTYRVLYRKVYQPEADAPRVDVYLEPFEVPVPEAQLDLWEVLRPLAQSAYNVLGEDGAWAGSDRVKDWFSYEDLERLLRVARRHGFEPET